MVDVSSRDHERALTVCQAKVYEQVLLFGDSITQNGGFHPERGFGFVPLLQHYFTRRLDVINRGFSGYNTDQARAVLPHIIPSPRHTKVRFMTVFFGANDAALPLPADPQRQQHVPIGRFKVNLHLICIHPAVQAHSARIILITPPPINEHLMEPSDLANGHKQLRRTSETTKLYAEAVKEVGSQLDLPVVDLWSAFMKTAGWKIGEPLVGLKSGPESAVLGELMYDGENRALLRSESCTDPF